MRCNYAYICIIYTLCIQYYIVLITQYTSRSAYLSHSFTWSRGLIGLYTHAKNIKNLMPSVLGFGERVWLNHPQHGWPLSLFSRAIFGTVIHGVEFIRTFFCLYQNGDFKFPSRVSICYQSIFVLKIGDHHSVGPVLMYSINSDRHAKIGPPRFQPDGFLLAFPRARIQSDRRCQWNDSFFCQFPWKNRCYVNPCFFCTNRFSCWLVLY